MRFPPFQRHRIRAALLAAALLFAAPTAQAEPPADWVPVEVSRTLQFDIASTNTGQRYRILLGLPHAEAPAEGYPVLWMLDGHASFPLAETSRPRPALVETTLANRPRRGARPAGLIVAIGYASGTPFDVDARALDYTPVPDAGTGDSLSPQHGGSAAFLRFLTQELRPLIGRHFPMNPARHTLFGFSYGGLFTVNTLLTEPQHFQRYWAASPSLWFSDALPMHTLPTRLSTLNLPAPTRLMMTVGLDEQYPATPLPPPRQQHLNQRAIVDHVREAGRQLSGTALPLRTDTVVAADHDHFDMLAHGARRVIEFAFAP